METDSRQRPQWKRNWSYPWPFWLPFCWCVSLTPPIYSTKMVPLHLRPLNNNNGREREKKNNKESLNTRKKWSNYIWDGRPKINRSSTNPNKWFRHKKTIGIFVPVLLTNEYGCWRREPSGGSVWWLASSWHTKFHFHKWVINPHELNFLAVKVTLAFLIFFVIMMLLFTKWSEVIYVYIFLALSIGLLMAVMW